MKMRKKKKQMKKKKISWDDGPKQKKNRFLFHLIEL